jgi:dephospho-CoA kinase
MVLGITGGMATGKSTVARAFGQCGATVIDADDISRRLTSSGTPLAKAILVSFGAEYSSKDDANAVDRTKLGNAIFHDVLLRQRLEAIVHPAIVQTILSDMADAKRESPERLIVAEIPLLYEANLQSHFDKVLVVWCGEKTQRGRITARYPTLSDKAVDERILAQMPIESKKALGDYLISTEHDVGDMRANVRALYDSLVSKQP